MKLKQPLFSDRLLLRVLTKSDVGENYIKWLRNKKTTKFLEARLQKQTREKIESYVEKCRKCRSTFLFGIFLKKKKIHIGNIKLCSISRHHKHCTIGILIGERQAHNQGYATESILCVVRFCKIKLKMKKVLAGLYKNNKASQKAFSKAGFFVEAVQKKHWKMGNKWVDGLLMAKIL